MEYGNKSIKSDKLCLYQGFDPATENFPPNRIISKDRMGVVNQRDADVLSLWEMVSRCVLCSFQNKFDKTFLCCGGFIIILESRVKYTIIYTFNKINRALISYKSMLYLLCLFQ